MKQSLYQIRWLTTHEGNQFNYTARVDHTDLNRAYQNIDNIHRTYPTSKADIIVVEDEVR